MLHAITSRFNHCNIVRGNFHKQNKWRTYKHIIIGSIKSVTIHLIINGVKLRDCFGGSEIYRRRWLYGYEELFYIKWTKVNINQTKPNQNKSKEQRQHLRKHKPSAIFRRRYRIITLKTVWNAQFKIDLWWDRNFSTNNVKKFSWSIK